MGETNSTEKSKYKGKAGDGTPKHFLDDRFRRCTKCFVSGAGYGEHKLGTMLITEIVRMQVKGGPNLDIAKAVRCGNTLCDVIADVRLFRAADERGITKAAVFALLRANKGTPTFTEVELRSGRLEPVILPDSIIAAIAARSTRPQFGRDYNPNDFTEGREPAAEEYPL